MDSTFAAARAGLVADLIEAGHLTDPRLRAAVEAVPRELFLSPGVFLAQDDGRWMPIDPDGVDVKRWAEIAYSDESLVTQLDGRLTTADVSEPLYGNPTSSSTLPSLVVDMIERLDLRPDMSVLEIGTGTGYSGALMCSMIGTDNVTTIEVDPEVARRADDALEAAGFSTWTLTGDGLIGWPKRAPYDRVICTWPRAVSCATPPSCRPDLRYRSIRSGTWTRGRSMPTPNANAGSALTFSTSRCPRYWPGLPPLVRSTSARAIPTAER